MVVLQRRRPLGLGGSDTLATDARAAVAHKKMERVEANMVNRGDSERKGVEEMRLAEELPILKRSLYTKKNEPGSRQ